MTETVRRILVSGGIYPRALRSVAPLPRRPDPCTRLAELVGIADPTAVLWAKLAAGDWSNYVARRHTPRGTRPRPRLPR